MTKFSSLFLTFSLLLSTFFIFPVEVFGVADESDWPMWRYDANRSAASPHTLPKDLTLKWTRKYRQLNPAWEDPVNQDRMPYDRVYEPIVTGSTIVIGFNWCDKITALDIRTGKEKWTAYAEGPVRFPPVAWNGMIFFVSDDGFCYSLDDKTGKIIWKFRGGPDNRKVLGNNRIISAWPARGGPVIKDGKIYFAASIWPFMGTFIHALDAKTGKKIWSNSSLGSIYMKQPHIGAVAFGGLAPQGAIAALDNYLLVPGGRSVPGCLDRRTGKLLYFHLAGSKNYNVTGSPNRKREGGSHVSAIGKYYFNHRGINTTMYDVKTGQAYKMFIKSTYPVLTEKIFYLSGNPVTAYKLPPRKKIKKPAAKTTKSVLTTNIINTTYWEIQKLWECKIDGTCSLIKAGNDLFAGGKGIVSRISLNADKGPEITWETKIDGRVERLIAGGNMLFAVTLKGNIYAFGSSEKKESENLVEPVDLHGHESIEKPASTINHSPETGTSEKQVSGPPDPVEPSKKGKPAPPPPNDIKPILDTMEIKKGYCFVYGLSSGDIAKQLALYSQLHVIGVDPDSKKIATLRNKFDSENLYGTRISLHEGTCLVFNPPPYIASLVLFERNEELYSKKESLEKIFRVLRPYGGSAWFPISDAGKKEPVEKLVADVKLPGSEIKRKGSFLVLTRKGALPGSAEWTHQYGDISNSVYSSDSLVKLPLGLLWFGGNSHQTVLPRHGHGPPEQIIGGRLIIEGINMLNARDVYTGIPLWTRTFDDLKTFNIYYNKTYRANPLNTTYNQTHIPGSNARGTNYVATKNKIYLVKGGDCLVLDIKNGKTIKTISLPADKKTGKKPTWGYIGVYKDMLVCSFTPPGVKSSSWHSKVLTVMDRESGDALWTRRANYFFRHNAITAGNNKIFCIDALPDATIKALKRRGKKTKIKPVLLALDIRTGKIIWKKKSDQVFGTWLSFHKQYNILLQAGRASRDMIVGEPTNRMITYNSEDGTIIWDKKSVVYGGPCILHGDTIYTNAINTMGHGIDLRTGEIKKIKNSLTGEEITWNYKRFYGCNYVIGSKNLLTFRSGAAGFYDLETDGGTGNLGGFKSGCTANLIAADGVLNAPDYTRTCTCSYQNQTSLALINMPDIEEWTFNNYKWNRKRVRKVGLNFGAPGDRRVPAGTLWLDCPSIGGASPDLPVKFKGKQITYPRIHSLLIKSGELKWVAASGVEGFDSITIQLALKKSKAKKYRVRLHFCELREDAKPGDRIFSIKLQGKTVMDNFDIVKEAGGPLREIIKTFKDITVGNILEITAQPVSTTGNVNGPILSGAEITIQD